MVSLQRATTILIAIATMLLAPADNAIATEIAWVPTTPEIGQLVVFTIGEHSGNIRTEWDFGENGCQRYSQYSTCQPTVMACDQMAFRFASGGEKTVSVTVKNPTTGAVLGTADTTIMLQDTGSCLATDDDVFVLQSVNAAGAGGSLFYHAMEVFNPGVDEAAFRADFLPRGYNNLTPLVWAVTSVPGETAVRFENTLEELFGGVQNMAGAIRIEPAHSSLVFRNLGLRTDGLGTDGWVIPEIRRSEGFDSSGAGYIINLRGDDDFRSNISCVNLTDSIILVHLEMFDINGDLIWSWSMGMSSSSNNQINRIFQDYEPVEGFVRVTTANPEDAFTCLGMVVTNDTNDLRTESIHDPSKLVATYYLPRAIHKGGSSTSVAIMAPSGPALVRFDLLPTGQDNTSFSSSGNFNIPAGKEIRVPDILDSVFGFTGTASLRVVTLSGEVAVSAHETTAPPGSNRHRAARVRAAAEETPTGIHTAIIQLTGNDEFRTDIGVTNTSGFTIDVWIDLRDATGGYLGAHRLEVLPHSHEEINGVFAAIGHPNVPDGVARISTSTHGGSFLAYAVLTELNSLDSWELLPLETPAPPFADDFEFGETDRWTTRVPD